MATTALPTSSQLDWTGDAMMVKDLVASGSVYVNGSTISNTTVDTVNNLAATSTEINRAAQLSTREVAGGATLTLTVAAHGDRTINFDTAAGTAITLPAATGTGVRFKFVVKALATSNSHTITTASGSDKFSGVITSTNTSTNVVTGWPAANNKTIITLNRTTTGSVTIGETIEIEDTATNLWTVKGQITQSGTAATPFS